LKQTGNQNEEEIVLSLPSEGHCEQGIHFIWAFLLSTLTFVYLNFLRGYLGAVFNQFIKRVDNIKVDCFIYLNLLIVPQRVYVHFELYEKTSIPEIDDLLLSKDPKVISWFYFFWKEGVFWHKKQWKELIQGKGELKWSAKIQAVFFIIVHYHLEHLVLVNDFLSWGGCFAFEIMQIGHFLIDCFSAFCVANLLLMCPFRIACLIAVSWMWPSI
jgi:hypothetical protein